MSKMGAWASYKMRTIMELLRQNRSSSCSNINGQRNSSDMTIAKFAYGYNPKHQGLQLFAAGSTAKTFITLGTTTMVKASYKEKVEAVPAPPPPKHTFLCWARWVLGSVLTVLLPFWKNEWTKLQRIEGTVEMVVEEVENVAEVVEKVAVKAEKVSSEVADRLPENGKLKETALVVEQISKAAAKDAQITLDFIHKVDALKHDFEDLETLVEPVVDKVVGNHT
ncbi:hypothetical protein FNV43_RR22144 [Rhamnella rubrinervis]|uniref:Uncharacterized protein n=1 Tax=Rhamnella rubrinervis TaxID=2594499 RepID=A0A8K0GMW2_9ROSA|nr:hypothetical protein FNV43_RR22144 [Rhamnella rubrinervis]